MRHFSIGTPPRDLSSPRHKLTKFFTQLAPGCRVHFGPISRRETSLGDAPPGTQAKLALRQTAYILKRGTKSTLCTLLTTNFIPIRLRVYAKMATSNGAAHSNGSAKRTIALFDVDGTLTVPRKVWLLHWPQCLLLAFDSVLPCGGLRVRGKFSVSQPHLCACKARNKDCAFEVSGVGARGSNPTKP